MLGSRELVQGCGDPLLGGSSGSQGRRGALLSSHPVLITLKTWDIMDRLPEIGVRTLLVGGRYDECTPGHLEEMHRRIAGSQLVIIEDASHLCFAERPEEFNRVINSFMT